MAMLRLRALERFVAAPEAAPDERTRCELCAAPIGEPHPHVVERASRALKCACGPCAILFRDPGAGGGRWRTVPERVAHDPALAIDAAEWAALGLPVRIACIHRVGSAWRAALPSPAGPVEAELPEAPWRALAARSPLVASLDDEVEALLVRRERSGAPGDLLLAPVDAGYALVALVKRTWRGFSGGDEAARAVDEFFAALRARSRPIARERGATHGVR